ncbi:hypothetical protein AMAG_13876 [Allomyces macrogynus ATCC 38327]|uniref:ATP-dependent RNA helicase DOB1 n=1 Tax=Allomyces macrogynus (strain ATCC 38327) TaxID=578462 RepID=A0A0L0T2P4_ALLM3|nr:hypothetical protein AMAG_13876 [Allomyces macrogynus ATCC 38327]|eukprot:KNE69001.1 hypothetical protein AMAG_13876 [Allomyces macrogynus ATCC 38327]
MADLDLDLDMDVDVDVDALFDAFDEEEHAAARLPPVPLPVPAHAARGKRSHSDAHADDGTVDGDDDRDRKRTRRGQLAEAEEDQVEVLDEFSTETEVAVGAVDGEISTPGAAAAASAAAAAAAASDDPNAGSGEIKFSKANVSTRHEVVLPARFDKALYTPMKAFTPPPMPEWARQYPFTLDPFQEYSIYCIQRNESVLVAAHTSAGKTVVAEYAIAQALRNKQRVIYTSPIKALSNQKYRELLEDFGDVGLMTGDVTISPNASCLVMTTEILRSMLYRGSEVLREIAWVVYDEIHYMRDKDRGVVWEETLILLPPSVKFVFLSATIPNAKQFAQWIAKIHHQPCHVVYTDYRPTPLQHYVFPAAAAGIHLVVDEKGTFREDNFQKAMAMLANTEDGGGSKGGAGGRKKKGGAGGATGGKEKSDIYKIVKMIMSKNYHPVIVFSFSKKECEALALDMSKLDFNDDAEKSLVNEVFTNAISQLNEDDQQLPQITNIIPLLRRGIGIHHSGLLPILKETIEILFQEGLLKVLFATETFSIGLNMPAKTVVFTKIEKFDGKELRHLTGGEYIQMSGRAGRRGLDDKGIVIMMVDQKIDTDKAKGMIKGEANALYSAFRLGYNMILNLTRVEGVSPEFLIKNSFRQFQNNAKLPQLLKQVADLEDVYAEMVVDDEDQVRSYYEARYTLDQYTRDYRDIITHPANALPYMNKGRLVYINANGIEFGWGIVVNWNKRKSPNAAAAAAAAAAGGADGKEQDSAVNYVVDVALLVDPATKDDRIENLRPPPANSVTDPKSSGSSSSKPPATEELVVAPVSLTAVASVSSVLLKLDALNLRDSDGRRALHRLFWTAKSRLLKKGAIPLVDPVKDMKISDPKFTELLDKLAKYHQLVATHPMATHPNLRALYDQYAAKLALSEKIRALQAQIRAAEAIQQLDELKARKRVLRRLGFTDDRDVVQTKGRVACEVSSGDPLLLTELLFHGTFNDLTVEQTVALLGVFTFLERSNPNAPKPKLREELAKPLQVLQEMAKRIARVSKEAKLEFNESEYLESFKPDLMDVVYAWAKGAKFAQICKMTDVFEGSLVRNFRLLEELLKQMTAAAKAIGNQDLVIKFTQGIACIKRDIIFANSLYL